MDIVGIVIAGVALLVAFWQGFLSKQQLEQAKETKTEVERLLDEIKEKVSKVETLTDETRRDVKEQISKLIDKQDENMKTLLSNPAKSEQNQMIMQFITQAMQNPDTFKTILEMSNKNRGNQ
ncbi:MAG: hypothetical protein QY314_00045 [Candidatus Dojkabacteria bacterium]|nr:MAG: hypothetical protein QY314_00045 [Candidatus Dojkabacteria bacterium]